MGDMMDRITIGMAVGAALGAMLLASPQAQADPTCYDDQGASIACPNISDVLTNEVDGMPLCPYEDGNPDGNPCIWISNEGLAYYVDSSEYRNDIPIVRSGIEWLLGTPTVPVTQAQDLGDLLHGR